VRPGVWGELAVGPAQGEEKSNHRGTQVIMINPDGYKKGSSGVDA
jgi:hypothetical protein